MEMKSERVKGGRDVYIALMVLVTLNNVCSLNGVEDVID